MSGFFDRLMMNMPRVLAIAAVVIYVGTVFTAIAAGDQLTRPHDLLKKKLWVKLGVRCRVCPTFPWRQVSRCCIQFKVDSFMPK